MGAIERPRDGRAHATRLADDEIMRGNLLNYAGG